MTKTKAKGTTEAADVPRTSAGGFSASGKGGPYGGGTESPGNGTRVQAVA